MHGGSYRLVDRTNVAVTRPALEKARWRCQSCGGEDNLRVIEHGGAVKVVCDPCRARLGSPAVWGMKGAR